MTTTTLLLAARGASAAAGSAARGLLPGFLRPAGGLGRRTALSPALTAATARFVHGTSPVLAAEVSRAPRRVHLI